MSQEKLRKPGHNPLADIRDAATSVVDQFRPSLIRANNEMAETMHILRGFPHCRIDATLAMDSPEKTVDLHAQIGGTEGFHRQDDGGYVATSVRPNIITIETPGQQIKYETSIYPTFFTIKLKKHVNGQQQSVTSDDVGKLNLVKRTARRIKAETAVHGLYYRLITSAEAIHQAYLEATPPFISGDETLSAFIERQPDREDIMSAGYLGKDRIFTVSSRDNTADYGYEINIYDTEGNLLQAYVAKATKTFGIMLPHCSIEKTRPTTLPVIKTQSGDVSITLQDSQIATWRDLSDVEIITAKVLQAAIEVINRDIASVNEQIDQSGDNHTRYFEYKREELLASQSKLRKKLEELQGYRS